MRTVICLWFFAACLFSATAFGEERQFKNGEAVTIQPDQAYLMARTFEVKGKALSGTLRIMPILVRVLDEGELQQAEKARQDDPKQWQDKVESNVVEMLAAEPYAQANGEVTLVTAVKPGTYVLAAVAHKGWAAGEGRSDEHQPLYGNGEIRSQGRNNHRPGRNPCRL